MSGKFTYETLTAHTIKILEKLGYPKPQAEVTAWVLVEADARGVPSHGVGRLPFYETNIKKKFVFPDAELEIVHETPISLTVDGHNGIGGYISKFAMDRIIEKAKNSGAGFASVRNSSHFGMAALWAEMASAEGFIGMSLTNTRICSIVTFGRERILGTNPICYSIPTAGKTPFTLDMATTTAAHGKVEVYERRNKPMPIGWCVDEQGNDTTDIHAFQKIYRESNMGGHLFLGGAGEELGGHKGYGLGLLVDLLCSGMSIGSWCRDTFSPTNGCGVTHFFGVLNTNLFGDPKVIEAHVESILQQVRDSEKAPGHDRIFIHGEKEWEKREESLVEGVDVDDDELEMLAGYAEKFGLEKLQ
jgi:L-2-hydroxycarboxylate dehydrogenase (NAD+)